MYLDFTVEIPDIPSKVLIRDPYVHYEYGREYRPDKKYNIPKRTTIGKIVPGVPGQMYPNPNYMKFFPDAELPEKKSISQRSSCLRTGAYLVIDKIIKEAGLRDILGKFMDDKDLGLFLDLAAYSIVSENNAGQYYPDYAYNHPLFTQDLYIYSDSKVSEFLKSLTDDQRVEFLNEWNASRDHREKIYISYDSTNKHCQAGDISMAEFGHEKEKNGKEIFNYSIAYDRNNREPLFYEDYPGSIPDIAQLQYTIGKAKGYGYRNIGFILDRGYFSEPNIHFMDNEGYQFVIMVKGLADFVNGIVMEVRGSFEDKRDSAIREYKTYGTTVKRRLYPSDEKERYFHVYYSTGKNHAEREKLENRLEKIQKGLNKIKGRQDVLLGDSVTKYFDPIFHKDGTFLYAQERKAVVERELQLSGYFCLVTSEKMTAGDALRLYKSRDGSEKLFRGDKSYLGDRCERVYGPESFEGKIFVEFAALIIRNRIYTKLKDEMIEIDKQPNYMTVPAAIRELEKIEMVRLTDQIYRMDHAVTKTQKAILKAFDIDAGYIKHKTAELSKRLAESGVC